MRMLMAAAAVAAALAVAATATATVTVRAADDKKPSAAPTVLPDPATPGDPVRVSGAGCTSSGTATSPALTAPIAVAANKLSAPGTLRDDLISGSYTLTVHCGQTFAVTLDVVANTRNAGVVTPHGSADSAGSAADDHLGVGDAALGSAFLLGGAAFGAVTLLRRRRAGAPSGD